MFFPVLTAGPVLNYNDFIKQTLKREFNFDNLAFGIKKFIIGLAKVLIVGKALSYVSTTAFGVMPNTTTAFAYLAIFCFMCQVILELTGISDMAIGLSKMFGFNINKNFNYPLVSNSYTTFIQKFNYSLNYFVSENITNQITNHLLNDFSTIFFKALLFSLFFGFSMNSLVIFGIVLICLLFENYLLDYFMTKFKIINEIIKTIVFYPVLIISFVFIATPTLPKAFEFLNLLLYHNDHLFNFTSGAMFFREYFLIYIVAIIGVLPIFKMFSKKLASTKFALVVYPICYIIIFILCLIQFTDGIYLPFFIK